MSGRGPCADCDPSSASTASVSSDLHKYHVACSCGNNGAAPSAAGQYAECAPTGPGEVTTHKVERPPALPPRPPPRPRNNGNTTRNGETTTATQNSPPGPRKYVWWCMGMGAAACLLGGLLLAAALLLRALTISLHHLETIPTPIPAIMLVLTGLCVMSLARRRNRYSYLIKVVGACCLVCALTCVLVTITTTVIHMNRLQTLRQCFYTDETKTCICSSVLMDNHNASEDEGVKCVFEEVSDCNAVHGSLYRCLSAIFGLSVAGVLVCICSAMLAYQLLSHERKKMYWEQLELRCRSLYRPSSSGQQTRPHAQQPQVCGECCTQCRAAAAANWDLQQRFWASGRVGNLYSPNPGTGRRVSPWSWFPWPRNSNQRVGGSSSGDSAYGFGNSPGGYWQLGPPPPYTPHHRYHHHHSNTGSSPSHHHVHHSHSPVHMPHSGCPMMNQTNRSGYPNSLTPHGSVSDLESQHLNSTSHHHHHQGSLRLGMGLCHQTNQMHSSVRVLQCHDPAILSLSPGHFVPISDNERQSDESIVHRAECHHQSSNNTDDFSEKLEDAHHSQHTCQKHSQHPEEEMESTDAQGEENLGFQCEKQSPTRQGRGGESELYFADVSSCCNVSLKTVEYCAGLVGTIETQADTSSGDSDVGSCPVFKGRPPRPRPNHSGIGNLQSESPSPHLNNARWKNQNSPSLNCSSPSRAKKKSPMISSEKEIHNRSANTLQTRSSPSPNLSNIQCRSSLPYQDQAVCFDCSDSKCKSSNRHMNDCQAGRKISQDVTEDGMNPSLSNIHLTINHLENCQGNSIGHHIEGSNRSSLRVKSSPNRSSIHHISQQGSDPNDVGLPPINQKRKTIDDSLIIINNDLNLSHGKKKILEESLNNDSNICLSQVRRKVLDESINDPNSSMSPLRRRGLEETMLNNELNSSLSPLRRKCVEDLNNEVNGALSQCNRKGMDDPLTSPMRRKRMDDVMLNKEECSKPPIRRKPLDDSMLSSDSNSSSSPFRRMCIEDSPISDTDLSMNSMRRQAEDAYINTESTVMLTPLRRKNIDHSVLNNSIDHKEINIPLRRKSVEDSLNPPMSAIKRKGIDESLLLSADLNNSLSPMRRRIFEDLGLVDDTNIRRKCVDEDSSMSPLRRKALDDGLFSNQADVNVGKLNLVHMMQHNARYSDDFVGVNDGLDEPSLVTEAEGSRRGIVGGVCIAPDLRYEPVQGFDNDIQVCENNVGTNHAAPVHMRCYSDSNTMDSGWQSGSEKHATD